MGLQDRLSHWHDDHRRPPTWYWPESWISRYALLAGLFLIIDIATRTKIHLYLGFFAPDLRQGEVWRLFSPLLLTVECKWYWAVLMVVCLYFIGGTIREHSTEKEEKLLLLISLIGTCLGGYLQAAILGGSTGWASWSLSVIIIAWYGVNAKHQALRFWGVIPMQGWFLAVLTAAFLVIDSYVHPWLHLPGIVGGTLAWFWQRGDLTQILRRLIPASKPKPKASPRPLNSYQQNFKLHDHPKQTQAEVDVFIRDQVDPILEKIARSGKDSLSADEKAILAKAKEMLGK